MRADTCIVQRIIDGKRYIVEVCDGQVVGTHIIERSPVCVPALAPPAPVQLPAPRGLLGRLRALVG